MMKWHLLASLAIVCAGQANFVCQGKEPGGSIPNPGSSITVFQGARVIDGTGAPAAENQCIIVEGKTIKSIGAQRLAKIPGGAKVIDAHGKTIMPELVLGHAHLGLLKG